MELAALEAELGQLHLGFSDAAFPRTRGEGAGGPTLEESIRRSRELRDQLTDVQGELLRIERHIARERILEPVDTTPAESRTFTRPRAAARRGPRQVDASAPGLDAPRRRAAARLLEHARYTDNAQRHAVESAARGLFDRAEAVRRDAVARLGATGTRVGLELIQLTVDDPSPRVRFAALTALVGSKGSAVVRVFRRFLHDENAQTRLAALRGLATSGHESATDALTSALLDRDESVRKTATTLLGWVPISASLPHLSFALRDPQEAVRLAAAEALGNSGDYRATLPLIRALVDESPKVKSAADSALRLLLGGEADALLSREMPVEERVILLKAWWRHARPELLVHGKSDREPTAAEHPERAEARFEPGDSLGANEAFESPIPETEAELGALGRESVPVQQEQEPEPAIPEEEAEADHVSLFEAGENADDQLSLPGEDEGDHVSLLDGDENADDQLSLPGEDEGDHVSLLDGDENADDQLSLPSEETEEEASEEEASEEKKPAEEEDGIVIGEEAEPGETAEDENEGDDEGYEKLF